nr:HD domain-containing protein [Ohessyouella blattaphilus]
MKGQNYLDHSYAVEVIMRGLAKRLDPGNEEYWGIIGLLHDLDEEQCDWQNDMSVHGPTSVEILKKEGIDDPVMFEAIKAHNPKNGKKARTTIEYAILAADPMSGFVKAVAQIYPDKKVASVKPKSVLKRFNELRFAAGANRDYMECIEFTGLRLEDLIDVALDEMTGIAEQIGL